MCSIDWGLVVNCLSAVGSIGAAGIALWIATRDRTERKRERAAADEAQAKLVLVAPSHNTDRSLRNNEVEFGLFYNNHSDQPILDVKVEKYTIRGVDDLTVHISDSTIAIVQGHDGGRAEGVVFTDSTGKRFPQPVAGASDYSKMWGTLTTLERFGWLGFTDLNGNRWARSSEGDLRLIRKPADIKRLPG